MKVIVSEDLAADECLVLSGDPAVGGVVLWKAGVIYRIEGTKLVRLTYEELQRLRVALKLWTAIDG